MKKLPDGKNGIKDAIINKKSVKNDQQMLDNLNFVKQIGKKSEIALLNGNVNEFALLMHEHWEYKKTRSNGMSNSKIDEWYLTGIENSTLLFQI